MTHHGKDMARQHQERHRTGRIGWLRAAVLGANDGIVSTASLIVGVAAANPAPGEVLVAGIAPWVQAKAGRGVIDQFA
jgi:vacuolar iron transporter family protein